MNIVFALCTQFRVMSKTQSCLFGESLTGIFVMFTNKQGHTLSLLFVNRIYIITIHFCAVSI